jgi:hypothetical protein
MPESIGRYDRMMKSMDRWGLFVLSGADAPEQRD